MVADGVGIAMLPRLKNALQDDWLHLLADWHIDCVPLYIMYYKNRGAVPAVRAMIEFILAKVATEMKSAMISWLTAF